MGAQGVVGSPQRAPGSEPGRLSSLGPGFAAAGGSLCTRGDWGPRGPVVLGCPHAHVALRHRWLSRLQPHPAGAGGGGGSGLQEMQRQTRRAEKKRSLIGNQQPQPRPRPAGGRKCLSEEGRRWPSAGLPANPGGPARSPVGPIPGWGSLQHPDPPDLSQGLEVLSLDIFWLSGCAGGVLGGGNPGKVSGTGGWQGWSPWARTGGFAGRCLRGSCRGWRRGR